MLSHCKKLRISVKRMVQRVLGSIPIFHKYYLNYFQKGNFLKHYNFLTKSQWFSKKDIAQYQNEKLYDILMHAYTNVPYYQDLFHREGIDPEKNNVMETLRKVPLINKSEVESHYDLFKAVNYELFKPIINKTSGSTGSPFKVFIDQQVDSFVHAAVWRHYNWAGCQFHSKSVYMGAPFDYETGECDSKNLYHIDATGKMLKLNTALINDETLPQICQLLEKFKPDYMHAYPSFMSVFSKFLLKNNSYNIRPKSVILRAEKLYPEDRKLIESVFHCPCFELYGMFEYITFASECEHHNLHLFSEIGITEIVKDGKVCPPGEVGEIVSTTLLNRSMPLVRYATGDYGRIREGHCACGRNMPMIEITGSREKDLIITEKGYFNVMSGVPLFLDDSGGIKQIQFYQKDKNSLTLRIVKKDDSENLNEGRIKQRLGDYLQNSINISIKYVNNIPRTKAGKYKYVDSEVPLEVK